MSSRGRRGRPRGSRKGAGNFRRTDETRRYNFRSNEANNARDEEIEKLSEEEVGIIEYISKLEGFRGIIKSRFSDFHVNEIALDGNIAKLTDLSHSAVSSPYIAGQEVVESMDEYPTELISTDIWDKIKKLIESDDFNSVVEIDVTTMTKMDRSKIHESVKTIFGSKIVGTTITREDKKYITFKPYNKKNKMDKREKWPAERGGEYVHFLVYKEHIDTISAAFQIAECLRMKASKFCYAGVKDRRAKTTQWFSVRKLEPSKIKHNTRLLRNIYIGNFYFKPEPLKLGELKGNRFRIALRDVTASDDLINKALESLKEYGFINYFGLQRFGNNKEVPTHEIGLQLLKGHWKQAVELILKPRKYEQCPDTNSAKIVYQETGNAAKAYEKLKKSNKSIESKLLAGLKAHNKNDYVNALENIPRNIRLLYIHAFQSLIWNIITSKRIKMFGLEPIVGDLIIEGELYEPEDSFMISEDANLQVELQEDILMEKEAKNNVTVKILKEEDLKNYTVYDVVLPLPGYDIVYPENCIKSWYDEELNKRGLSLEMPKQKVKTYTLSGTYRRILERVTKLSWYTIGYNHPDSDLIRSDIEELHNVPQPESIEDSKYKGLIIDFCLSTSCYATMALREIMKMDTSTAAHILLSKQMRNNDSMSQFEAGTSHASIANSSEVDKNTANIKSTNVIDIESDNASIIKTEADSTSEIPVEKGKLSTDTESKAKSELNDKMFIDTPIQNDANRPEAQLEVLKMEINVKTEFRIKTKVPDRSDSFKKGENDSMSKIGMVLKTAINTEDSLKAGGELQIKSDVCKIKADVCDNASKTEADCPGDNAKTEHVRNVEILSTENAVPHLIEKRKLDEELVASKKAKFESEN